MGPQDSKGAENQSSDAGPGVFPDHAADPEPEIHWLDLLIVIARRKYMIARVTLLAAVLSVVIVFLIPKEYEATSTLVPSQSNQSVTSAIFSQLGPLAGLAGGQMALKSPTDVYVAMLQSRSMLDTLVRRFDLMKVYGTKLQIEAEEKLAKRTDVRVNKLGLILVTVSDRDPKRAADLATAYVEELFHISTNLAVTEAAQRRWIWRTRGFTLTQ